VLSKAVDKKDKTSLWAKGLHEHNHMNLAAVALANKNARIAWAILTKKTKFESDYVHSF